MPRGGRRAGKVGRAYGNRTDLNANKSLPVQTATGQAYGVAGQQQQSQQVVPLRPQPAGVPAEGAPGAQPAPPPGSFGAFDRPTDRPDEPLTAGAPFGAGPGAEAMALQPEGPPGLVSMLSELAAATGSRELGELADWSMRLGGN